ncbi:hypothetical protein CPB86DRAFT_858731 [Serendipita vermifera]|nr:hypothetical protein CPB86DRAFT_858731 [Serendipita vermifera]
MFDERSNMAYEHKYMQVSPPAPGPNTPISNLHVTELADLHWNLRSDLAKMTEERKEDSLLQERKTLLNQVVGTLHDLEISWRIDPMERLPNEIITRILLELSTYSCHPTRRLDDLFTWTMVCKKWQSYILSEPLLWNVIILNNHCARGVRVSLQLTLSRGLPLTIEVALPLDGWSHIKQDLRQHRDRIKTIISHDPTRYYPAIEIEGRAEGICSILNDLGPLLNLRRLEDTNVLHSEGHSVNLAFDRFPSLTEIINFPLSGRILRMLKNRRKMETLATYENLETMLPMAQSLESLKKVTFLNNWRQVPLDSFQSEDLESNLTSDVLRWTELFYYNRNRTIPSSFLSRLPLLVVLEIGINFKTFYEIIKILHQFPKLLRVRVDLITDVKDEILLETRSIPNMGVHSLQVIIYSPRQVSQPTTQDFNGYLANNIHQIPLTLLQVMPNVKSFDLQINTMPQSFPFFSLDGIFHGQDLRLCFDRCEVIPQNNRFDSLSVCKFCEIPLGDVVQWSKASLAFLRRVTIWSHTRTVGVHIYNVATSFIRDLACSPESYLSLEEIKPHECPECDILVIMLERRNLLAHPSIKTGYKTPAPFLLSTPNSPVETQLENFSIIERIAEYPDSEDEILATWGTRARLWDELNPDGGRRVETCGKDEWHEISSDTWDEYI